MDLEDLFRKCNLTQEKHPIAHVIVEEVPNSQNPHNAEHEYNPFVSQSLSQPGPSNQASQPGPSNQPSQPGPSNQPSQPGPSNQASQPGPSNQASQPGPSNQAAESVIEFTAEPTSVKKKRGRPSRASTLHLKPTRGSQRTRKCPKVLSYESFSEPSTWQWSEKDKKSFLAGILEVGVEDIEGLKRFLPHKTENDIKSQIAFWKGLAARSVEKSLAEGKDVCGVKAETIKNLDEWIKLFKEKVKTSKVSTLVMSTYFEIVAEYGEFPSPEECGGVDFRAMYRYLHCMINGIPHYGINGSTVPVLLNILDEVLEKLDDPNLINSLEEHLLNQPAEPDSKRFGKTYSRKGKNASGRTIDKILRNPIMNPLNIPESAVIKKFEDDEDSD